MVASERPGTAADVHTHPVTREHICVIYGSAFSGKDTLGLVKMKKKREKTHPKPSPLLEQIGGRVAISSVIFLPRYYALKTRFVQTPQTPNVPRILKTAAAEKQNRGIKSYSVAQQKPSSLCSPRELCLAAALRLIQPDSRGSGLEFGAQTKT